METLSYGYKRPQTGDRGSVWFPALEDNITRLNAHDHDGTDSAFLPPSSFTKFKTQILAADWSSAGNGMYTRTVTVPSGISGAATYNDHKYYDIFCQLGTEASPGDRIYPRITRTDADEFVVTVNDNTIDLLIYYV